MSGRRSRISFMAGTVGVSSSLGSRDELATVTSAIHTAAEPPSRSRAGLHELCPCVRCPAYQLETPVGFLSSAASRFRDD